MSPCLLCHYRPYDGTGSFEIFWAHFENCASYNRWKEVDKLAHLKADLTGNAGQVLWDTDLSATDTLAKLTALLRSRYSGSRQETLVQKYVVKYLFTYKAP